MKPVQPDDSLAAVIGANRFRTEVTKSSGTTSSHKLQDPANKTLIQADDKLKAVFDGKTRQHVRDDQAGVRHVK